MRHFPERNPQFESQFQWVHSHDKEIGSVAITLAVGETDPLIAVRISQPGASIFDGYHLDNIQSSRLATPNEADTVISVFHNAYRNSVNEPA